MTHPHEIGSFTRSEEKFTGDCDSTVTRDAEHPLTRNPFISLASKGKDGAVAYAVPGSLSRKKGDTWIAGLFNT
jgi:hypothetical protein